MFLAVVFGLGLSLPFEARAGFFCSSALQSGWRTALRDVRAESLLDPAFVADIDESQFVLFKRVLKDRDSLPAVLKGTLDLVFYVKDHWSWDEKTIVQLSIVPKWFSSSVELRAFRVANPFLSEKESATRLNGDQQIKGWSIMELKGSANRLFALLKKNGIRQVVAGGAENYVTSVLYRRFLGFRPCARAGEKNYAQLDALYARHARAVADGPRGLSGVNRFSDLLGMNAYEIPPETYRAAQEYLEQALHLPERKSLRAGVAPWSPKDRYGHQLEYGADGEPLLLWQWPRGDEKSRALFYVAAIRGQPMVMHWSWLKQEVPERYWRLCRDL